MRKELLIGVAAGLTLMGLAAYFAFWVNKGSHVVLEGSIQKVRTLDLESASVMVLDFRVTNPSDYPFVVKELILDVDAREGMTVAETDARRLFQYYPALGQKFNDTLKVRDKVLPKQTIDRMVAVRFEVPEKTIANPKLVTLKIEEVDGLVSEIRLPAN